MKAKSLSIKELQESFLDLVKIKINEETERQLMWWLEGHIVNAYNNCFQERYHRKPLYEKDIETGENKLLITSIVKENA